MLRTFSISLLSVIFLAAHSTEASAQQPLVATAKDPRINKKIIIVRAGAEMKTPQATVWKGYLGEVFTVTLTNGEWLWIDEKGGWLWEKEAVPFDSAIEQLHRSQSW